MGLPSIFQTVTLLRENKSPPQDTVQTLDSLHLLFPSYSPGMTNMLTPYSWNFTCYTALPQPV